MATRIVRLETDPILRKKSKKVDTITDDIIELIEDMKETMIKNDGVGIAAVQVGVLKRVIIVELQKEGEDNEVIEMINPEILEEEGEQTCNEGCLSLPGITGDVIRPERLKVKFLSKDGKEHVLDAVGLSAVVISHETDHLEGVLFLDKAIKIERDE